MENIPDDPIPINDSFVNEQLANVNVSSAKFASPWFANYANFIVGKVLPPHFAHQQRKKFFYYLRHYFGMILSFIRKVWMVLLDVVYLRMNNRLS